MHHHYDRHHDHWQRWCGHRGPSRGGRGFFGGFPEDRGADRHGFRGGRKLSSDDLQLVILALVQEKPRHGYEIIKAIEELSTRHYVPSPGVIYPSLSYLEEAGYVDVELDGSRKLHRLTASGGKYLAAHRPAADAILAQIEKFGRTMEHFRATVDRHGGDDRRGRRHRGDRDEARDGSPLGRARAALKSALFDARRVTPDVEARMVEILDRATAEVRALQASKKFD